MHRPDLAARQRHNKILGQTIFHLMDYQFMLMEKSAKFEALHDDSGEWYHLNEKESCQSKNKRVETLIAQLKQMMC
jgi:hypothetical protein